MSKGKQEDGSGLVIDPYDLDGECVKQPLLFFEYSQKLAEARLEYEKKSAAEDFKQAEISRDVRDDPAAFGLTKITEDSVKSTVKLQREFVQAVRETIEAKYLVETLQGIVTALDHRKRMLESLVSLQGQNYFSAPKIPKEARERVEEEATKKTMARTKAALNR